MTSLPSYVGSFQFGSAGSVGVGDAIASYRRSQYIAAAVHTDSSSAFGSPDEEEDDEEDGDDDDTSNAREQEFDRRVRPQSPISLSDDDRTPLPRNDFTSNFDWDDDLEAEGAAEPHLQVPTLIRPSVPRQTPSSATGERMPLLHKVSFSEPPLPRHLSTHRLPIQDETTYRRRLSSSASTAAKFHHVGQSTFGQTLFNSIAILLGIGMLSEPLAFSYAGWIGGTILIFGYGAASCYTAKILARIVLSDGRLRSYSDIGKKAFGPKSTAAISFMFCLELFAVSVILVTLYADSLTAIFPNSYSATTYKLWGLPLMIITVFLPLSLLSYTSILGISSTVFLAIVICADGVSKKTAPGSLWSSAETSTGVADYQKLGAAFGLFIAGFSGHSVIPSLARDMIDPSQFESMINWAFTIATAIYALIGWAGYRMFGNNVSEEISIDLLRIPEYSPFLNQAALWMLVISPLSKFALATQPIAVTIDSLLGIDIPTVKENAGPEDPRAGLKRTLAIAQRIFFTLLSVATSILLPEFSTAMSFLGSFSAFLLCLIGPICAKMAIERKYGLFDIALLVTAVVMSIWGTGAAF